MGNIRHTFTSPLRHDHTCHLLYSTYSKYEEDWSSYPHTHYFTELFFVLSGSGSFLVEDETFPIAKHDLIVINPNITHTEKSSLEDPLEYIVLGVDGLNFVIDDANEYLLFHSDEMKDQLDFYFRTILEETTYILPNPGRDRELAEGLRKGLPESAEHSGRPSFPLRFLFCGDLSIP